jgi:hypothetical protein
MKLTKQNFRIVIIINTILPNYILIFNRKKVYFESLCTIIRLTQINLIFGNKPFSKISTAMTMEIDT